MTQICVTKFAIIGSYNGLSPIRRQAIIWTSAGILLIRPLGTNFGEILIQIHTFSNKKMHLKMSSGKCRPFCLGLNVLRLSGDVSCVIDYIPQKRMTLDYLLLSLISDNTYWKINPSIPPCVYLASTFVGIFLGVDPEYWRHLVNMAESRAGFLFVDGATSLTVMTKFSGRKVNENILPHFTQQECITMSGQLIF